MNVAFVACPLRAHHEPRLPDARGPLSEHFVRHLRFAPHDIGSLPLAVDDPVEGDDSALALYMLYELHYRSFREVDDEWEWEPSIVRARNQLERAFERRLRDRLALLPSDSQDVRGALQELASTTGPSLSSHMQHAGTVEQMREFAIHRSAYQRKEADPHTWAIPRLAGRSKAALVDIQFGEYGDGVASDVHAEVFADTMRALSLDPSYGHYLDAIPGVTLATVNLVSFFGLHRRLRGALVGHLALFEMSSVIPMGRYAAAMRRFGLGHGARFYDAHVDADARHEVVALDEMAVPLAEEEPALAADIIFGARAVAELERAFAQSLLDAWTTSRSSLRTSSR
jgi:hypothetical protein